MLFDFNFVLKNRKEKFTKKTSRKKLFAKCNFRLKLFLGSLEHFDFNFHSGWQA